MTVFPSDETDAQQIRRGSADSQSGTATPNHRARGTQEWQMLVECCDAVSLVRVRDGMTKGLAPVIGYLRSAHPGVLARVDTDAVRRLFKRVLKAVDPELAKIVIASVSFPTKKFWKADDFAR
jgi:hypothetical protein